MRAALNISLPKSMRSWVDEQVERSGYGTASEFIRALIRDAQTREARENIDATLRAAMQSEAAPMTASDWKDIERRVFEPPKKTRRKK
jgi:antitoxin ParD1/3/4